jgi:hypothetical protein
VLTQTLSHRHHCFRFGVLSSMLSLCLHSARVRAVSRVDLGLAFLLHEVDVGMSIAGRSGGTAPGVLAVNIVPPPSADLDLSSIAMVTASTYAGGDAMNATITYGSVECPTVLSCASLVFLLSEHVLHLARFGVLISSSRSNWFCIWMS